MKTFVVTHSNCPDRIMRAQTQTAAIDQYASVMQLNSAQAKRIQAFERVVSHELLAAFDGADALTTVEE